VPLAPKQCAGVIHELAFLWPWGDNNSNRWTTLLGGWPQTLEGVGAVAAGYTLARKHNCHVKGCLRIGRHPVEGTTFITCHTHHPRNAPPSHQDVLDAHAHRKSEIGEIERRFHLRKQDLDADDNPAP
jgi:hypothetical protein